MISFDPDRYQATQRLAPADAAEAEAVQASRVRADDRCAWCRARATDDTRCIYCPTTPTHTAAARGGEA